MHGLNQTFFPSLTYTRSGNMLTFKRRNQTGAMADDAYYYYQSGTNRVSSIADYQPGGGIDYVWYGYDANGRPQDDFLKWRCSASSISSASGPSPCTQRVSKMTDTAPADVSTCPPEISR